MSPKPNPSTKRDRGQPSAARLPRLFLRRADQLSVAALCGAALIALVGWWLSHGGVRGRLLELEQAPEQTAQFMVDVNQADWPELAALPGVGETIARRIVTVRSEHGPYVDHNDLSRVPGIGPRTLDRIRPYLLPMAESASVAGK